MENSNLPWGLMSYDEVVEATKVNFGSNVRDFDNHLRLNVGQRYGSDDVEINPIPDSDISPNVLSPEKGLL
jgi:hypothetical protein